MKMEQSPKALQLEKDVTALKIELAQLKLSAVRVQFLCIYYRNND